MKPSHLSVFSGSISLDHSGEEVQFEPLPIPRQEHRNVPMIQSRNAKQKSPFLVYPGSAVYGEFFLYFILIIFTIMTDGSTKIKKNRSGLDLGGGRGEMNSNKESGS